MFKKVIPLIFLLLLSLPYWGLGQELNCTVDVVSPQIQDASAQLVFKNMKDAIYQFMNNTKWTGDNFTNQEKIDCSLYINITTANGPGDYSATLQVQARRPVYKSSYQSVMMNYQDNNIHILYTLNQPIIFNINAYTDNLTALLSFYAYMIIANDYDSYSSEGGTQYYLKAQTIVINAQSSGEKGWNSQDGDQTRYTMVNNIIDETYYASLRKAMYVYHRQGLDNMYTDGTKGRAQIIDALGLVQDCFNARPANFNISLFFNAKATEIANIFSEAPNEEKSKVMAILNVIDVMDIDKYTKLKTE